MSTIKEIACRANVSIATVSNVLNNTAQVKEETRVRVQNAAKELEYTPNIIAKNLKNKKTHTIGVITEDITAFNTSAIVDGIDEFRDENGYHFILSNLRLVKHFGHDFDHRNECFNLVNIAINTLLSKQVEGIIYVGHHYRCINFVPAGIPIPLVFCYCFSNDPSRPFVYYDDEQAAFDMTEYLISLGHRKIGVVAGPLNSTHTLNRLRGYEKALYRNKMLYSPDLIQYGDWDEQSGYECTASLLPQGVTAIFAMNDLMAGGTMEKARELNYSVPERLSVAGFDNRECSSFYTPQLTTVSVPFYEIGRESVKILLSLINNPPYQPKTVKFTCSIVKRESTGICFQKSV